MRLVRNDRYHGSASPDVENRGLAHVDGVTINWVADTDAQINALKSGEAHMIWTQPQVQFEELNGDERFEIVVTPRRASSTGASTCTTSTWPSRRSARRWRWRWTSRR